MALCKKPAVSEYGSGRFSTPAEKPLDVGELEFDIGRPAVIALPGAGRRLHLAKQGVHLLGAQAAAGAHGAVAGHGGGQIFEPPCKSTGRVPFRKLVGKLPHQSGGVHLAEHCRRFADGDRRRAEALDGQPEPRELLGMRHQPVAIVFRQADDLRNEQRLRGHRAGVERRSHRLEDEPLMGGVLVDDDEAVVGLATI